MSKEEMRDQFETRWGQTNDEQGLYFIPELNTYGCELAKNRSMADRKSSAWYYFQLGQESALAVTPKADAQPAAWIKPDVLATIRGDECCYAFGEQSPKGNLVPLYTRSDAGEVERLRDELESTKAALREEMKDAFEFQQKNLALVELLRDIYNQNELSGFDDRRILAVIDPQPADSGASA
jgi:hypothetical protein